MSFLVEYPEVQFKKGVLLRDFPANFVRATERDRGRNTCPICSNFRRRLFKLHLMGVGRNIALSTRAACVESMCLSDQVLLEDATTWNLCCVDGECQSCPPLILASPDNIDVSKAVEINLWKKGPSSTMTDTDGAPKEVFRLFPEVVTVGELKEDLIDSLEDLEPHVYVTKWQWTNQRLKVGSLEVGDIVTVEDYQMNMSVELSEAPTTSVFGSNQLAVTLYPLIVFYRDPTVSNVQPGDTPEGDGDGIGHGARAGGDGDIKKADIAFISDNRVHGWEQIADFNRRTLEIMNELGVKVKNWTRLSDGCASQYKSKYTVLKLTEAVEMIENVFGGTGRVRLETFGSYEGKNESDALGSLVKNILTNAINKDRDGAIAINDAKDAVKVINDEKPENSTKKYSLWRVEFMPPTVRKKKPLGLPIKGFRKMHSFSYSVGGVMAARLSCKHCTVSEDCADCLLCPDTIGKTKVEAAKLVVGSEREEEEEEGEEEEIEVDDTSQEDNSEDEMEDNDEESDEESVEESDDESEDEMFAPGDVVWALFSRQWFCAKVVSLGEVPEELHRQLKSSKEDSVLVMFYVCKSFSRVPVKKIEILGESLTDKKRMLLILRL